MHTITETKKGYDITLTRGDSFYAEVGIEKNGEPYAPAEGDSVRFAMKKNYSDPDSEAVLVVNIPTNTLVLHIEPEDTKTLPMKSKYVYDIQLTTAEGDVDTFIEGRFMIDNEVL